MRRSFFTSLILYTLYEVSNALTPTDCLKKLTNLNELETQFAGTENVYCAYLNNENIQKATFNIKDTNINDWDITIGNWDTQNAFIVTKVPDVEVDSSLGSYKISLENVNANAIVWVLNNEKNGEITDVNLVKRSVKREENNCNAFDPDFIWEDISWDSTNEKVFSEKNSLINLNNTVYLNTLALLFKRKDSNSDNDYFTGDYTLNFKIKSDSSDWAVYTGQYNRDTHEVEVCEGWNLNEKYPDITVNTETLVSLPRDEDDEDRNYCNNNLIWFQNIKNDQNSQRIWISKLAIKNCNEEMDD